MVTKLKNLRSIVLTIYKITFVLGVAGVILTSLATWQYISFQQALLFGFYILLGFCGVLIAYWLVEDDRRISFLEYEIRSLKEKEN